MAKTLRDLCQEDARELVREIAATADLWTRDGLEPDEIPYVLMQIARVGDLILQALEPASDSPGTADLILAGARDAILDEAIGGC